MGYTLKKYFCECLTRADDLGRIVIPKEIRKTLKIQEGSPLEIFTDSEGGVIFRKYSPIGEMANLAGIYAQTLQTVSGKGCIICDTDRILAVAGLSKKEFLDKGLSEQLRRHITEKKNLAEGERISLCDGSEKLADVFSPILSGGDPLGAVLLIPDETRPEKPGVVHLHRELVKTISLLLGKQAE
ncbi:MAG: stage V sporulation T C-terminal domain-containing protein [Oscillospiraceae bacterium]